MSARKAKGRKTEVTLGESFKLSLLFGRELRKRRLASSSGHLRQNARGFSLERRFQRLIVLIGKLARLMFEIQVAQVFVHRFLALLQVSEPGLVRTHVQFPGKIEDIDQRRQSHHSAGEKRDRHISVSFLA